LNDKQEFFDFAAEVGLTKHFGGVGSTEALAEMCRIGEGSYVLDVGCGVGVTPCFLARRYGCRVVGVDIRPAMVERSRERARKEGLADKVEFRVADAQCLPFEDNLFDAVTTESVTAFPADKQKAVDEYARVTRPGGYVGLAEATWRKVPPPPELVEWVAQDVGATVMPLTPEAWVEMLRTAGLQDIAERLFPVNVQNEAKEIVHRYGWGGMFSVIARMLALYARNPAYRRFVKQTRQGGIVPASLNEYFGYGLYAGRK
jgi:ubiquinone/menaquinone biosynthesis C-methylase UbiE